MEPSTVTGIIRSMRYFAPHPLRSIVLAAAFLVAGCGDDSASGGDGGLRPDGGARSDGQVADTDGGGGGGDDGGVVVPPPSGCRTAFDPSSRPETPRGSGAVYYVDGENGDDGNDGLAPERALQSLGDAVGRRGPLSPGDTLLIAPGRYRGPIEVAAAGTMSQRIVIGPSAPGDVVIDSSIPVTWMRESGDIYRASVSGGDALAVVVDDAPLAAAVPVDSGASFSAGSMREGTYLYDAGAHTVYVWIRGGGDPTSHEVGVVADDAYADGVLVNDASDVTLYGIDVRYAGGHGVSILGDRVRIERCDLAHNGKAGVSTFSYGGTSTEGVEIVANHIHDNVLRNWPRGRYPYGGWSAGSGSNGTPGMRFVGNLIHDNGGEGIACYAGDGGTEYVDNVVYDNWSVNLYVDNQPNAVVEGNFVFCHDPRMSDLDNNGHPEASSDSVKRLRAIGIMTADEDYGLSPPANLQHVTIRNNVIVNCRYGLQHYADAAGSGLRDVRVLDNTIVVPSAPSPGAPYAGISIPSNGGNNSGAVYRNNVVVATGADSLLVVSDSRGGDAFAGLSIDHNLFFHADRDDPFNWGNYDDLFDHDGWVALAGTAHGTGDVTSDPGIARTLATDPAAYTPADGSGAVGVAADDGVVADFFHRGRGMPHDLGAIERDAEPCTPGSAF